jgi:1,4-alpha-glucan branching enzyme
MLGPGDLWYKDAIVYALSVDSFQESNGDGIGDFPGLTSRVEYLHALGVTCVWLLPFYPSPNRDHRYDVADYYGVDPRLGTLGDFVDFLRVARAWHPRDDRPRRESHVGSAPVVPGGACRPAVALP